ncbi:bolA-like protein DDB_G0274169 [Chironomus tepperi]|uniref:bolA-like protein DDB_G0274169 n=1 Tax=Chironomus tepperi TaxID=113505 RepID=UPI00391F26B2
MSTGPIQAKIEECLNRELTPNMLEIVNESYMHGVPKNSETHFKVLVVSEKFNGLSLIQRHRIVNNHLKEELKTEFPHALSIVAKIPTEVDGEYKLEPSPNCRGGFGK